jgi:hypothetical protein
VQIRLNRQIDQSIEYALMCNANEPRGSSGKQYSTEVDAVLIGRFVQDRRRKEQYCVTHVENTQSVATGNIAWPAGLDSVRRLFVYLKWRGRWRQTN